MSATQKFIRYLFGETGDRTAVPDATQVDGTVSYQNGYGLDYQRQKVDPLAKNIERNKMNQVFYDLSLNQRQYQTVGSAEFIAAADNGGAAYAYPRGARVYYPTDGETYQSLATANVALPTDNTKWRRISPEDIGGMRAPVVYSSAVVLSAAAAGDLNRPIIFGGTTYAATLPAANAVPPGSMIRCRSNASGTVTLTRAGADTIQAGNGNNALTTVPLFPGDSLELVSDGVSAWLVLVGSAQLQYVNSFANSLGASGWEKMPSGRILQWFIVTVPASSSATFTLPLTFPSAFYGVAASQYGTTYAAGANAAVGALPNGLSQVNVQNLYSASSNSVQLLCIGK